MKYSITIPGKTIELDADMRVDEFGYWFESGGELVLHVAHGTLQTVAPSTGPVPSKAESARDRLKNR